jgi:hypothetical protein
MICFKCDSGQESAFSQEEFPCSHCDGTNLVEYNICPGCGWMWRSVNGVVFDDSQMSVEDLGDFAGLMTGTQPDMTEEELAMMNNINEQLVKIDKMDSGEATMSDYVHKCLQCNSTAVDVNDGTYKCTDCGFEWEIVKFE